MLIILIHLKVVAPQPVLSADNYSGMVISGQVVAGRLLLTQKLSKVLKGTKVTVNILYPGNIPDSSYGVGSSSFQKKCLITGDLLVKPFRQVKVTVLQRL